MKASPVTRKQVILSVKAGRNISVAMVRDLGHVVQRENAQIGRLDHDGRSDAAHANGSCERRLLPLLVLQSRLPTASDSHGWLSC
jgi:hypothetical protein